MRLRLVLALLTLAPTIPLVSPAHAQWQLQDPHVTADLRGIDSLGNGVAWASGTGGTVLRTEDAGFVWQLCAIPPGADHLDFRGIQAFNNNTAIVMSSGKGDLSRLYKTTDGCQTWTLLFTNPDKEGFWNAISLRLPKRDAFGQPLRGSNVWGYILGDPVDGSFALFETRNGGKSWSRRRAVPRGPKGEGCKVDDFRAVANEAAFAASNESLFTLSGDYLLFVTGGTVSHLEYNDIFSLDGALCHNSAHAPKLPLASGNDSSGAFALAAMPDYENRSNRPDKLVIVGGDYTQPSNPTGTAVTVFHIGVPFLQSVVVAQTPPHGYRSAVAYDPAHNAWITVGPNGTDLSTDDGRNWRPLKPGPGDAPDADEHWNALSLPFVVGPHGRIGTLRPEALNLPKAAR